MRRPTSPVAIILVDKQLLTSLLTEGTPIPQSAKLSYLAAVPAQGVCPCSRLEAFGSQAQGGRGGWDDFITEECCSLRENQTTLQFCFTYSRRGGRKKNSSVAFLCSRSPRVGTYLSSYPEREKGKRREGKQGSKNLFCSLDFKSLRIRVQLSCESVGTPSSLSTNRSSS